MTSGTWISMIPRYGDTKQQTTLTTYFKHLYFQFDTNTCLFSKSYTLDTVYDWLCSLFQLRLVICMWYILKHIDKNYVLSYICAGPLQLQFTSSMKSRFVLTLYSWQQIWLCFYTGQPTHCLAVPRKQGPRIWRRYSGREVHDMSSAWNDTRRGNGQCKW